MQKSDTSETGEKPAIITADLKVPSKGRTKKNGIPAASAQRRGAPEENERTAHRMG